MIARAQTRTQDLKVDRVLLAGGGASLKGLDLYLNQAMGVPVERFNPFDLCDLSQLSARRRQPSSRRRRTSSPSRSAWPRTRPEPGGLPSLGDARGGAACCATS